MTPLKTDPALLARLIEASRNYRMSPEEQHEQRRSWVRGMCPSRMDYAEWCAQVDRILPPLTTGDPPAPVASRELTT